MVERSSLISVLFREEISIHIFFHLLVNVFLLLVSIHFGGPFPFLILRQVSVGVGELKWC